MHTMSIPLLLLFAAADPAIVEPQVVVAGLEAECDLAALQGEVRLEGKESLTLEPGLWELRVSCTHEQLVLSPEPLNLKLAAGQKFTQKIEINPVSVRLEARHDGNLTAAEVQIYPAGKNLTGAPLATIAANRAQKVAAGKYDLLVTSQDKKVGRAEAWLPNVKLAGPKLMVLNAVLGEGTLIVSATTNGKKSAAAVRAFVPGTRRDVGMLDTDQEFRLPAGRYEIHTELRDTADFSTKIRSVWVESGKTAKFTETFETGQLSVAVVQDNQPVKATIRLSKTGLTDYFNYFEAPGPAILSPGTYDVIVVSPATGPLGDQKIEKVVVRARATTTHKLDLSKGTILAQARQNGQPWPGTLIVRGAGGGDPIQADPTGQYRVWPGRYEVAAVLGDGTEQVDGPFEVNLRQKIARKLDIRRGILVVETVRAGAAVVTEIQIFKPGAGKPLITGPSSSPLDVPVGTYDVKISEGSTQLWKNGVKLDGKQKIKVELPAPGQNLPEGDTPEVLPDGDAPN